MYHNQQPYAVITIQICFASYYSSGFPSTHQHNHLMHATISLITIKYSNYSLHDFWWLLTTLQFWWTYYHGTRLINLLMGTPLISCPVLLFRSVIMTSQVTIGLTKLYDLLLTFHHISTTSIKLKIDQRAGASLLQLDFDWLSQIPCEGKLVVIHIDRLLKKS